MIPDSHAHLDLIELSTEMVLSEAREAGVSPIVTIGINLASSRRALEIAASHAGVYASVGIHPNDACGSEPDLGELAGLASAEPAVVAIGETGLDYYRKGSPREVQERSFREQIRLAKALGKSLVVHSREAHRDTLTVLDEEKPIEINVIMHCFSGDREYLDECVKRGFYVSFAGPLTFKNAHGARSMAALAPADRLLVETDSPFLSPEPFRGKPNFPSRVRLIAEAMARARDLSIEDMEATLSDNMARAFGLEGRGP